MRKKRPSRMFLKNLAGISRTAIMLTSRCVVAVRSVCRRLRRLCRPLKMSRQMRLGRLGRLGHPLFQVSQMIKVKKRERVPRAFRGLLGQISN